jgi:hypothetical protein
MKVQANLRDQGVSQRELGHGKARDGELADADYSDPKL